MFPIMECRGASNGHEIKIWTFKGVEGENGGE